MQILAQTKGFGYFSNQTCCILQYITDSIRLIPVCIRLLPHLVCPEKSFFANTTLGVSHYETYHPRLRRRPGSHRCSCFHPDLLRLHPEQGRRRPRQRSAHPQLRSRRSQRLWYGSRPVDSAKGGDRYPLVSIFLHIHVINCCVRAWNTLG